MSGIIAPQTITLTIPGTLTTNSIAALAMPYAGYITDAYVAVTTAPTGAALTADLKVGSSVAAAFSIAINGTSDQGSVTTANAEFAAGDVISLDVSQIGSSAAGAGMTVTFVVEAKHDAGDPLDTNPIA